MCTDMGCCYLPSDWFYTSLHSYDDTDYKLVELQRYSPKYTTLSTQLTGSFNLGISKIVRVENPYLYEQFLLKREEYEVQGSVITRQLYHDTGAFNASSIVSSNLDWRRAHRVKYGKGVSFSPYPCYANQESSRSNGTDRAMIVADVLIQNQQSVYGTVDLPAPGYDTTVGNASRVYVKYYDNEFYPTYVVYYTSRPHVRRGRYW